MSVDKTIVILDNIYFLIIASKNRKHTIDAINMNELVD